MRAFKSGLATIFAIGLVAGSAVGVAAQDDEASMAPSSFTGGFTGGQPDFSTDPETGLTLVVIPFEATDSRASGTWTFLQDGASIEDDEARYQVFSNSVRVENDRGTWVGEQFGLQTRLLPDGDDHSAVLYEFAGEAATRASRCSCPRPRRATRLVSSASSSLPISSRAFRHRHRSLKPTNRRIASPRLRMRPVQRGGRHRPTTLPSSLTLTR